jgi:hypothetical protein
MDFFRGDFRDLDKLNIAQFAKPIPPPSPRQVLGNTQRAVLKSAASFGENLDTRCKLLSEIIRIAETPPGMALLLPATIPLVAAASSALTVAIGLDFEIFVGMLGGVAQGGAYASSTPEVGLFRSLGVGLFLLNAGISVGPAVSFIFGPPSVLAGNMIGVQVGVSFPGTKFGAGGALLFVTNPIRFAGFAVSASAGASVLPVTVSLQITDTKLMPLLKP